MTSTNSAKTTLFHQRWANNLFRLDDLGTRQVLAKVLKICTCIILGASFLDLFAEHPLSGGVGLLLAVCLFQHAVLLEKNPARALADIPSVVASCAWAPLYVMANGLSGYFWCVPAMLLVCVLTPATGLWSALAFNLLSVFAASAYVNGVADAIEGAVAMLLAGGLSFLGVYYSRGIRKEMADKVRRLELALRCSGAGTLDWNLHTGRTEYSPRLKEMLGYQANEEINTDDYFDLVHPDDRNEIRRAFFKQLKEAAPYAEFRMRPYDYRLMTRRGDALWIHAEAVLVIEAGAVSELICTLIDINATVRTAEALARGNRHIELLAARLSELEEVTAFNSVARKNLGDMAGLDAARSGESGTDGRPASPALSYGEVNGWSLPWLMNFPGLDDSASRGKPETLELGQVAREAAQLEHSADPCGTTLQLQDFGTPLLAFADRFLCTAMIRALTRHAIDQSKGDFIVRVGGYSGTRVGLGFEFRGADSGPRSAGLYETRRREVDRVLPGPHASTARLIARGMGGDVTRTVNSAGHTVLTLKLMRPPGHEALEESMDTAPAELSDSRTRPASRPDP